MGWRATIRAIEAAERRAQREEQRRFRELQRLSKEHAKLTALEQARLEVDTYENQLEVLLSIHKEQGEEWDWLAVSQSAPPPEPVRTNRHEADVEARQVLYVPGFFARLFGKAKKQEAAFGAQIPVARARDDADFQDASVQYQRDCESWQKERQLAQDVLAGSHDAYEQVLRELTPFTELSNLGSALSFRIHSPKLLEVLVKVNGQQAIPSEVKSLTATGKVSTKAMPRARFHEIYQDYVCGCVLRVGREAFAVLPIETILVTASADLFDSRTGCTSEQPILSVVLRRTPMRSLNFNRLDPSDAIENFLHRGDFKTSRKAGAFATIIPLTPVDVVGSQAPPPLPRPTPAPTTVASPLPPANPFAAKWAEALRRNEIDCGFLRLSANGLVELLGGVPQKDFTLPESKALARAVEDFGYCLEPDPRHGGGSFWGDREVGIFQPPSGSIQEPSVNFLGACALLQLSLLVAAADGTVDRDELKQFRRFIESQFTFTPDEHQRLVVLDALPARNAASAKVTLGRTAKRVPQDKHIVVAQFLVDVAAADGVISPKEHKALLRIFEALGLNAETLDTLIGNLAKTESDVVVQRAESGRPGEAIPSSAPGLERAVALKLDMARVAAISAETHEVVGLLAKAMAEDEASEPSVAPVVPNPEQPLTKTASVSPSVPVGLENDRADCVARLDGLDVKFHSIIQQLVKRESWSRTEFDDVAREHKLMSLNVIDVVNEWSDQTLGDFLLEGEDPITCRRGLLRI